MEHSEVRPCAVDAADQLTDTAETHTHTHTHTHTGDTLTHPHVCIDSRFYVSFENQVQGVLLLTVSIAKSIFLSQFCCLRSKLVQIVLIKVKISRNNVCLRSRLIKILLIKVKISHNFGIKGNIYQKI